MPPFLRVEDRRANANALGILVPPGQRTFVILRPRGLKWDLLTIRVESGASTGFCLFDRDEAAGIARQVQRDLEQSAHQQVSPMVTISDAAGTGFQIGAKASDLYWIVCARVPGQPYKPLIFSTRADAESAVELVASFVFPSIDANQQYYFNTQNFTRG